MDYLPNTDSLTNGQLHKNKFKRLLYMAWEEVINRHAIKENIISVSFVSKIPEEQNFRFELFNKFQRNAKFY